MGLNFKVDDIITNVRSSIDRDFDSLSGGTPSQTRGTLMRGALREMRVSIGAEPEPKPVLRQDVADFRSRIQSKIASMENAPIAKAAVSLPRLSNAVVPTRGDFADILSRPTLRPSYAEKEARDDLRYAPQPPQQPAQHWPEPEPEHYAYGQDEAVYGQQPDPYAPDPYANGYEEQHYHPQLEAPLVSPQTEAHAESAFRQLSDAILARATGDRSLEEMTRDMLKGMLKQWLDANLPAIVEDMVREEIQRVARRGR